MGFRRHPRVCLTKVKVNSFLVYFFLEAPIVAYLQEDFVFPFSVENVKALISFSFVPLSFFF
jgi:hypothetical protein